MQKKNKKLKKLKKIKIKKRKEKQTNKQTNNRKTPQNCKSPTQRQKFTTTIKNVTEKKKKA